MGDETFSTNSSQPTVLAFEMLESLLVELHKVYDLRKEKNADYLYFAEVGDLKGTITKVSEQNGKYLLKIWTPDTRDSDWLEVTAHTKIYRVEVKKPKFNVHIDPIYEPPPIDRFMYWNLWKGMYR